MHNNNTESSSLFSRRDSACVKGVAVLLLLFHHLFYSESLYNGFSISFDPFSESQVVKFALMAKICVSMFAFVSGYGLCHSYRFDMQKGLFRDRPSTWCIYRYLKLMAPFFLLYFISFIVTYLLDGHPLDTYFKDGITLGFLYMTLDLMGLAGLFGTPMMLGSWWYMSAAVAFVAALPLLYLIGKKAGWFSVLFFFIAMPYLIGLDCPGSNNPLTFMPAFTIGMLISDADHSASQVLKSLHNHRIALTAVSLFLLLYIYKSIKYDLFYILWPLSLCVLPVLVILLIKYWISGIPLFSDLLAYLGKISMPIFVLHGFLRAEYLHDFIYSREHFILIFLILTALSVLIAIAADVIIRITKPVRITTLIK